MADNIQEIPIDIVVTVEQDKVSAKQEVKPVTEKNGEKQEAKTKEKKEKTEETDPASLIPTEPYYMSQLFHAIAEYFNIERADRDEAKYELSTIVDWAIARGKSNKIQDILTQLKKVEQLARSPSGSEKRYKNVHGYVKMALSFEAAKKALDAYKKWK